MEGHPEEIPQLGIPTPLLDRMEEILAEHLQEAMVEGRHCPKSQGELQGHHHQEEGMTLRTGRTHWMRMAEVHLKEEGMTHLLTLQMEAEESHHQAPQMVGAGTHQGTLQTHQGVGTLDLHKRQEILP